MALLTDIIKNGFKVNPAIIPTTTAANATTTTSIATVAKPLETNSSQEYTREQETSKNKKSKKVCNDNMQYDARTALSNLQNSSLFEKDHVGKHFDRMVCAIQDLVENNEWKINMDTDGDGTTEDVSLADAIATSFDSELDLYIQEEVNEVIRKYGHCSKEYLSNEARMALALKGIRIDSIGDSTSTTNRAYSFSLVDVDDDIKELMKKDNLTKEEQERIYNAVYSNDAKIMEDSDGNKGSYIFADCLIPDGYAQGAEVNLSSILDQMGYDCISKADFIGKEGDYEATIRAAKDYIYNKEHNSTTGINDLYGNTKAIQEAVAALWGGNASAPGTKSHSELSESSAEMSALRIKQQENSLVTAKAEKKAKLIKRKIEEYQRKLYQQMIEDYKEEHDGKAPSRQELQAMEQKAKSASIPYTKIEEFEKDIDENLKKNNNSFKL